VTRASDTITIKSARLVASIGDHVCGKTGVKKFCWMFRSAIICYAKIAAFLKLAAHTNKQLARAGVLVRTQIPL
jgi:hypothetical protein